MTFGRKGRLLIVIFSVENQKECVSKGGVDSFAYTERGDCLCILLIRGGCCYINPPSSLKKRDNSVGSVGKSEKSPENSPRKVFQNVKFFFIV